MRPPSREAVTRAYWSEGDTLLVVLATRANSALDGTEALSREHGVSATSAMSQGARMSVEGAAESGESEERVSGDKQGEHRQIEAELVEIRAFQFQRPHHPEEMDEREDLPEVLSPSRHDELGLAYTSRVSKAVDFPAGVRRPDRQGLWASQ